MEDKGAASRVSFYSPFASGGDEGGVSVEGGGVRCFSFLLYFIS